MKKRAFLYVASVLSAALIFLLLPNAAYAPFPDADNDTVSDDDDLCLNSLTQDVDQFGCSCAQKGCVPDDNPCTDDCELSSSGMPACNTPNNAACDGGSCEGGRCVASPSTAVSCTDSDGGRNIYVKGDTLSERATGGGSYAQDSCRNYRVDYNPNIVLLCSGEGCGVQEGYCNAAGEAQYEAIFCPNGCVDGACAGPPQASLIVNGIMAIPTHPVSITVNPSDSVEISWVSTGARSWNLTYAADNAPGASCPLGNVPPTTFGPPSERGSIMVTSDQLSEWPGCIFILNYTGFLEQSQKGISKSAIASVRVGRPSGSITSITPRTCYIPPGQSACSVNITWSAQNAPRAGIRAVEITTGWERKLDCPSSQSGCVINFPIGRYNIPLYENADDLYSTVMDMVSLGVITVDGGTATSSHPINEMDDYNGFIIELEDDPLVVKKADLDDTAGRNQQDIDSMGTLDLRRYYKMWTSITPDEVPGEIADYKDQLREKKEAFLAEAGNILQASSNSDGITGNAVAQPSPLAAKREFSVVYNGVALDISREDAERLRSIEGVKNIHPNYIVNATLSDSAPLIGADAAWLRDASGNLCGQNSQQCLTGKGITIGIIDTGVDYTHPDLGACSRTSNINDGSCQKVIGGYDFVNRDNDPMDDRGHGTHVAATAAGNGILKGIAPDAKIVAYKVLDSSGSGYDSDIIAAIDQSVDPNQDGDFSDHLDIISLSLGGRFPPIYSNPSELYEIPDVVAIENAVRSGVVAVIAAGNSGPSPGSIRAPGISPSAITVGAITKSMNLAYLSSRGPVYDTNVLSSPDLNRHPIYSKPDIVAPGVRICAARYPDYYDPWVTDPLHSRCIDDLHVAISGTSMATPMVSGAAALLLQAHPNWSPAQVKQALKGTAIDLGYDENEQGAGMVDIPRALNMNRCLPGCAESQQRCGLSSSNRRTSTDIMQCVRGSNGCLNWRKSDSSCPVSSSVCITNNGRASCEEPPVARLYLTINGKDYTFNNLEWSAPLTLTPSGSMALSWASEYADAWESAYQTSGCDDYGQNTPLEGLPLGTITSAGSIPDIPLAPWSGCTLRLYYTATRTAAEREATAGFKILFASHVRGAISRIDPDRCYLQEGQTTCPISIAWQAENAPNAGIRVSGFLEESRQINCPPGPSGCIVNAPIGIYDVSLYMDAGNPNSKRLDRKVAAVSPPSDGSITNITPNPCVVSEGQDTCPVTITWRAENELEVYLIAKSMDGTLEETICAGTLSPCTVNAPPGIYQVNLHTKSGRRWLDTRRLEVSLATPSGSSGFITSITPNPCYISSGQSTCSVNIVWGAQNAPKAGIRVNDSISGWEGKIDCPSSRSGCTINAPIGKYRVSVYENADNPNSRVFSKMQVNINQAQ